MNAYKSLEPVPVVVADEVLDARAGLRARARRLGLVAEDVLPHLRNITRTDRERVLDTTEDLGPVLDELWTEGR